MLPCVYFCWYTLSISFQHSSRRGDLQWSLLAGRKELFVWYTEVNIQHFPGDRTWTRETPVPMCHQKNRPLIQTPQQLLKSSLLPALTLPRENPPLKADRPMARLKPRICKTQVYGVSYCQPLLFFAAWPYLQSR